MCDKDLSRRYFAEKYIINKVKTTKNVEIINQIEKDAKEKGAQVSKNTANLFLTRFKSRWSLCKRNRKQLEKKYRSWLDKNLYDSSGSSYKNKGTKTVPMQLRSFSTLSESQKRRRTVNLRQENTEELVFAASSNLRKEGKNKVAKLINESLKSPHRAEKMLSYNDEQKSSCKMSGNEALALYLDCDFTKCQYLKLRANSKKFQSNIYPNYHELLESKKSCYPGEIHNNHNEIYVALQYLLDHTAQRFLMFLFTSELPTNLIIYYKLGFDGSSGHAELKHVSERENVSDNSVIITTIVPVRIVSENDETMIWLNPASSSTRYCRPVKISYKKESTNQIKEDYERLQEEIRALTPSVVNVQKLNITITHKVFTTMLDVKSINAIEENKSTQVCYICHAGPSNMNNLNNRNITFNNENIEKLQWGISPLHARIKFMEFILNLSYRQDLPVNMKKKGVRKDDSSKDLIKSKKQEIQNECKRRLNLLVDVPKQGFGSYNDGNTARKFFENYEIIADITKLEEDLIYRFYIILIAINTSQEVDPDKFGDFTYETAKILTEKYNWWPMSPTVHKVLLHGHEIIAHAILPLGQLSEEAQEHRNKDFKSFKSKFSRKSSRDENLTDIFNRFLMTSDPLISHLRESTKNQVKTRELPKGVVDLLKLDSNEENEHEVSDEI